MDISLTIFKGASQAGGALQKLHVCKSLQQLHQAFKSYQVGDDYDHSFLYFDGRVVHMAWKNSAGVVQFCGSGAFAASKYIFSLSCQQFSKLSPLTLTSSNFSLSAYCENKRPDSNGRVVLEIPSRQPKFIKVVSGVNIYFDGDSGVYLLHYLTAACLSNLPSPLSLAREMGLSDIHGLCCFSWDDDLKTGFLRYFVPWHGRYEDYVTGSIHTLLTPLVYEKYGVVAQRWMQVSSSPGVVETEVLEKGVALREMVEKA